MKKEKYKLSIAQIIIGTLTAIVGITTVVLGVLTLAGKIDSVVVMIAGTFCMLFSSANMVVCALPMLNRKE